MHNEGFFLKICLLCFYCWGLCQNCFHRVGFCVTIKAFNKKVLHKSVLVNSFLQSLQGCWRMPRLPCPSGTLLWGTGSFLPCSWLHVEEAAKGDTPHISLPLACCSPGEEWINQIGDLGRRNWARVAHSLSLLFGSESVPKMCPQLPSAILEAEW